MTKYLVSSAGTYNAARSHKTNRLSVHAYGAAIDLATKFYWLSRRDYCCRDCAAPLSLRLKSQSDVWLQFSISLSWQLSDRLGRAARENSFGNEGVQRNRRT
jgi:hypothetical protein